MLNIFSFLYIPINKKVKYFSTKLSKALFHVLVVIMNLKPEYSKHNIPAGRKRNNLDGIFAYGSKSEIKQIETHLGVVSISFYTRNTKPQTESKLQLGYQERPQQLIPAHNNLFVLVPMPCRCHKTTQTQQTTFALDFHTCFSRRSCVFQKLNLNVVTFCFR